MKKFSLIIVLAIVSIMIFATNNVQARHYDHHKTHHKIYHNNYHHRHHPRPIHHHYRKVYHLMPPHVHYGYYNIINANYVYPERFGSYSVMLYF